MKTRSNNEMNWGQLIFVCLVFLSVISFADATSSLPKAVSIYQQDMTATTNAEASQNADATSSPGVAQTHPEIARFATETVKKVAKTDLHRILTTPLAGCLTVREVCREFDTVLREDLEKAIPGVVFVAREEAVQHLTEHGFLTVDAYMGALELVASYAGADGVVAEDLEVQAHKCQLHTRIVEAKRLYVLAEVSGGIPCSELPAKTRTSALKDPLTGVSMIITVPNLGDTDPSSPSPVRYPSCVRCPDPHYSGYAKERQIQGSVRLLITVTEQGTVQDARVLGGVEESLARVSLEAVQGWQFKPAIGSDGKPFQVRVPVEVTFRLLR